METHEIDGRRPSKWIPITDLRTLALLGKLAEECGELSAILGRCIIQGLDGVDPDTGETNRANLAKEIADVRGLSALAIRQLELCESNIAERAEKKLRMKRDWIGML